MLTIDDYIEMLTYMRPQGSSAQKRFCNRYLKPVFGIPDDHGNYMLIVGDKPKVAFMAHHDTVHHKSGRQIVKYDGVMAHSLNGNCLGADCTTGVYIILKMIAAKIPGVYVVHAAEEIGCIGSSALVEDSPMWFSFVDAAISFDRKGYTSIITHQLGRRTCSEEFAGSLSKILGGTFKSDNTGAYTDSNEYRRNIKECTNLSVGYFSQHTSAEKQDLVFLEALVDKLIKADWSQLLFSRDPSILEYDMYANEGNDWNFYRQGTRFQPTNHKSSTKVPGWNPLDDYWPDDDEKYTDNRNSGIDDIVSVIKRYPEEVANILESYGYTWDGLLDDCDDIAIKNRKSYGRV